MVVWIAYGVLILAWRTVIAGWGQHLRVPAAVRIWCVSNLGRYLPGKIWSAAGLAVLAQREGVTGWVAAGAAVAMQVLAVGTGVAVVAAVAPGAATPTSLTVAGVCAVGAVVALTSKRSMAVLSGLTKGKITLEPLPFERRSLYQGGPGQLLSSGASWAEFAHISHTESTPDNHRDIV